MRRLPSGGWRWWCERVAPQVSIGNRTRATVKALPAAPHRPRPYGGGIYDRRKLQREDVCLINDAGLGYPRRFADLPDLHTMRAEIDLNYMGTVYCTYYALPYLKQTRGRLVGVNSFGGQVGIPGTAGYNASKHAMRGFLNTLRVELHGTGVTVSVAYLGAVRTERLKKTMGDNVNKIPTMDPKRVAALIIQQAARRQRQQVMTFPGKFLLWLNKWSPTLVDRILVSIRSISYQE